MKLGITYPLNRRDLRSHIERRDGISNNGHITTIRCRFLRVITRPLSFDLVSTNPSIKRWIRDNTSRRERERERELPRRRESLVVDRLLREVFRRFCLRTGYAWAIYKRTYRAGSFARDSNQLRDQPSTGRRFVFESVAIHLSTRTGTRVEPGKKGGKGPGGLAQIRI